MSSKRFSSVIALMFFLFVVVFGSAGCGGGSSSNFANEPNNPAPNPNPDPAPTPNTSFTVTFDSNGGTEIPSQTIASGGTVVRPDNPVKDGNVFVSWYRDNNDFKNMFLFGPEGDQIAEDTTLYAQWLEYNPDLSKIQYAISQISINYSDGDNSAHVTKNLTLPTNFKDENLNGITVTWLSDNVSVIGANGTVRRPRILR